MLYSLSEIDYSMKISPVVFGKRVKNEMLMGSWWKFKSEISFPKHKFGDIIHNRGMENEKILSGGATNYERDCPVWWENFVWKVVRAKRLNSWEQNFKSGRFMENEMIVTLKDIVICCVFQFILTREGTI